jgi:hypothetical protein
LRESTSARRKNTPSIWPNSSAWFALTLDDGEAALAGIAPFLENQRRLKKSHPPAGFNYLGQKRWTLLEQAHAPPVVAAYPRGSVEARAIAVTYDIAGAGEAFRKILCGSDGAVRYREPMTPRLAALAQAPPPADWVTLDHQQAGAWEGFLRETVTVQVRKHLKQGDRAPWPFPPSVTGKIYTSATGPPEALMIERDFADFK